MGLVTVCRDITLWPSMVEVNVKKINHVISTPVKTWDLIDCEKQSCMGYILPSSSAL